MEMKIMEIKAINALRILGVDAINQANSGHPGIVLGAAPMVYTLFTKHLNVNVKKEDWISRDRFILSAGHGSALLYAINHFAGYKISLDDIKNFRQIGNTPGHPEYGHTSGVETTSGPLGQGVSNAVGMAIAEAHLASRFNKEDLNIINNYTYALVGDGDLQEGVALEAMSLAGHLGLNKLIVLFDSNDIQLDGPVNLAYSENHKMKFTAMGWNYIYVEDGNDVKAIDRAIKKAKKQTDKPSIIEIKTVIGYGTNVQGTSKVHGSPIGMDEAKNLRTTLGWENDPFVIDEDVYAHYKKLVTNRGSRAYSKWKKQLKAYSEAYPQDYQLLKDFLKGKVTVNLDELNAYAQTSKDATRNVSGKVLDHVSKQNLNIIGGSADLTSSTKAKGSDGNFTKATPQGRNINFGVREHAMGAIVNGITLYGGLKAFSGAFFVFSDYMKPALRLAAIMNIPSIAVFTHDSIGVGEDGPTHQPIEQLAGLRAIPNFNVIRPADANETIAAWKIALESKTTPTALVLTRQNVKNYDTTSYDGVMKGAYIVSKEEKRLDGILLATGSEVELAMETKALLKEKGLDIRVVSMPSMFLFDKMPKKYQESILPKGVKTLAIEMASPMSFYKYTQNVYGMTTFGASTKAEIAFEHFGFTKENIAKVFTEI